MPVPDHLHRTRLLSSKVIGSSLYEFWPELYVYIYRSSYKSGYDSDSHQVLCMCCAQYTALAALLIIPELVPEWMWIRRIRRSDQWPRMASLMGNGSRD